MRFATYVSSFVRFLNSPGIRRERIEREDATG